VFITFFFINLKKVILLSEYSSGCQSVENILTRKHCTQNNPEWLDLEGIRLTYKITKKILTPLDSHLIHAEKIT